MVKAAPRQQIVISLLGGFEVQVEGRPVIDRAWPRRKAQALLKLLALQENHSLHREQIFERLWPDLTAVPAGNNLRQGLHYLRAALAERGAAAELLSWHGDALSLAANTSVDVDRFRGLAEVGLGAGAPEPLEQALSAYTGDLLPDDLYEEWTEPDREQLRELRNRLLLTLGHLYETNGHAELALDRFRELLRFDPACEQAHQALMGIYAKTARRQQALRQYETLRASLRDELGVEPSAETDELHKSIVQGPTSQVAQPATPSQDVSLLRPFPSGLLTAERSRFVGRDGELEQLRNEWSLARAGERRLVFLSGEAGIGKTRLAGELAAALHAEGAAVLFGRSDEEPLDTYQPIAQALRTYLGASQPPQALATLLGSRPLLAGLMPDVALPSVSAARQAALPSDSAGARLRLFEEVDSLLRETSAASPTLLILDDLHWAEKPALLLLRYIAQSPGQSPLLIVGTYREDEVTRSHPLAALLADLRREHAFQRVALEGLNEDAVRDLIVARRGEGVPPAFVRAISNQTEGNPFFLEETLSHLAESGEINWANERWINVDRLLPQGVRDVVVRRLMRLSADCNQVLRTASVAGAEFTLQVLEKVTGSPTERLLDALEEALEARVIAEVPQTRTHYGFSHALIRSVLYDELSAGRKARLHQLVGEAVEQLTAGQQENFFAELAHHFSEAGTDPDRAMRYSRLAAGRAMASLAYEEAADHNARALLALDQCETDNRSPRCEILLSLGDAHTKAGNPVMAKATFDQAAALARELASGTLLAQAALGLAGTWVGAGFADPSVVALLEEAANATAGEDSALRSRVLARLAVELYYSSPSGERAPLSKTAVDIARRLGDPRELAYALNARYYVIWGPGSVDERLAIATEMLALAEGAGDLELALQGHHFRALGFLEQGDVAGVNASINAYHALAERLRQPIYLYRSAARQAMLALLDGRYVDAEQLAAEAQTISHGAGDRNAAQEFAVQTLMLRREQGRIQELEPTVRALVTRYPAIPAWRAVLASICAQTDRPVEAGDHLEWLVANDFRDVPEDANWLATLCVLGEVCAFLRDLERADRLYNLLLPHAGYNVIAGAGGAYNGSVSLYLAGLATVMSRWDDATGHFEAALDMHQRMGARPWTAHAQFAYAMMLRARARPEDGGRAEELLGQALATAEALGMKALSQRALAARATR